MRSFFNLRPFFSHAFFLKRSCSRNVRSEGLDTLLSAPDMAARNKNFVFELMSTDTIALIQKGVSWVGIKNYFREKEVDSIISDQRFSPKSHAILGPNLAAAYFIIYHGGKVKFSGSDAWVTKKDFKTQEVSPSCCVEGIDVSGTHLCYEGLENLAHLYHMKQFVVRNCEYIDDWCLHRIGNLFEGTLTHLDISGCKRVTEKGICALYKLKKLKNLVLNDTPNIADKELACMLLEDLIPKCKFTGVDGFLPSVAEVIEI